MAIRAAPRNCWASTLLHSIARSKLTISDYRDHKETKSTKSKSFVLFLSLWYFLVLFMDDFVKVTTVGAVDEAGVLVVEHCARRIAIYREGDRYFALEDICPHMGAFLSRGFRKSGIIICPWHNWVFELQ